MRLMKIVPPVSLVFATLTFPSPFLRSQTPDASTNKLSGTAPHTSADKYHAHATSEDVSVGAELLSSKEVSKEFAANLNRCCIVVQVAVFPKKDQILDVSMLDFTLTVEGTETTARPQSAIVITARLQKDNSSNRDVTTTTGAGVGYESGTYTDPVTGQPVHVRGVTTSAEAGVSVGNDVPPVVADHEREVIRQELDEKGFPDAKASVPVSGYLYFALPKQKKDTRYRLEYAAKSQTLALQLP